MRATQTCPKCAGKKFAVSEEFRTPYPGTGISGQPLPVLVLPPQSVFGGGPSGEHAGHFETWICVRCGYTEFYAHGVEDLDALAEQYPKHLRIVDAGPPAQGPYR